MESEGSERYNVVFYGVLKPDHDLDDVKYALTRVLKADLAKVNRLFLGERRVLKHGATPREAEKYWRAFDKAGAVIKLERIEPAQKKTAVAPTKESALSLSDVTGPDKKEMPTILPYPWLIGAALAGTVVGGLVVWGLQSSRPVLTDEEVALVRELESDLRDNRIEQRDIEARIAKYSGGLVLALLQARQEVVKATGSLIEQRIHAIESGASIEITVPVTQPDPDAAQALAQEITSQEQKIAEARRDTEQYGGLIGAIRAATLATQEQTLATLRLRYLSAKYGLAGIAAPSSTGSPALVPIEQVVSTDRGQSSTEPAFASNVPAYDGPFGLKMGLSAEELGAVPIPGQPGKFVIPNLPRSHPLFVSYYAQISPKNGLCWLKGVTAEKTTDRHGIALKTAFNDLEGKLDGIYGSHERVDRLIPGSLWDEPEDWMMGLLRKERFLYSVWNEESGATLSDDLSSVAISAVAASSGEGQLHIEYTFANETACDAEINQQTDAAL